MMILAIDTSGPTFAAALLKEDTVLTEIFFQTERHHSELLLPGVERMLQEAHVPLPELDLLACTVGPGSFTGIRIGVSTVKGLALAAGKPVVGVSALEALALNAAGFPELICPLLDAKRGQVYTGLYRSDGGRKLTNVLPDRVVAPEAIMELIAGDALFIGSGVPVYEDVICARTTGRNYFAAPHLHRISAAAVGVIAWGRSRDGELTDHIRLSPMYIRRSEAEEKEIASVDRESKFP